MLTMGQGVCCFASRRLLFARNWKARGLECLPHQIQIPNQKSLRRAISYVWENHADEAEIPSLPFANRVEPGCPPRLEGACCGC